MLPDSLPERPQSDKPIVMARLRHGVALLLVVLLALAVMPGTLRAADGVIEGQIVGRNGAGSVAGTTIVLEIATSAGGQPVEQTTTARADGSFRFDRVPLNESAVYLLRVVYDGGNYFREVEFVKGSAAANAGTIEVYPAVRDATSLVFARMNTIFSSFDRGSSQAIETGAYRNDNTRAYIGSPGATNAVAVRFGLPQGAGSVQPAQGLNRDTLIAIEEPPLTGFGSIEAVPPGEHQFAYIYRMEIASGVIAYDRVFPYPTELYSLYLPVNARLAGGSGSVVLRDSGEQTLQNGGRFRVYTANNIPAGARLTARFTGLPGQDDSVNPLLPLLALFALVVGVGLIAVYGRRRRPATAAASSRTIRTVPGGRKARGVTAATNDDEPADDLAARKERLLLELVNLDERFEAGTIPEAEYRRKRKARKDDLVATLRELGQSPTEANSAAARRQ